MKTLKAMVVTNYQGDPTYMSVYDLTIVLSDDTLLIVPIVEDSSTDGVASMLRYLANKVEEAG